MFPRETTTPYLSNQVSLGSVSTRVLFDQQKKRFECGVCYILTQHTRMQSFIYHQLEFMQGNTIIKKLKNLQAK